MEVITLKKSEFSNLILNYRKSLLIMDFLIHLTGKLSPMDMSLKADEVCKLFGMSNRELREARKSGWITGTHIDGRIHYKVGDIIELKLRFIKKEVHEQIDNVPS